MPGGRWFRRSGGRDLVGGRLLLVGDAQPGFTLSGVGADLQVTIGGSGTVRPTRKLTTMVSTIEEDADRLEGRQQPIRKVAAPIRNSVLTRTLLRPYLSGDGSAAAAHSRPNVVGGWEPVMSRKLR